MEGNNFEGLFPFILIITFYLVKNWRARKQKEERDQEEKKRSQMQRAPQFQPPPKKKSSKVVVPTSRVKEERLVTPSVSPPMQVKSKRSRIQKIVKRLHSKKDLVIAAEILNRRCF